MTIDVDPDAGEIFVKDDAGNERPVKSIVASRRLEISCPPTEIYLRNPSFPGEPSLPDEFAAGARQGWPGKTRRA